MIRPPHWVLAVLLFAVAVAIGAVAMAIGADAYARLRQPAAPRKSDGVVAIFVVRCDPDNAQPLQLTGEIDGTTVLSFRDREDADRAVRAMMLAGVVNVNVGD